MTLIQLLANVAVALAAYLIYALLKAEKFQGRKIQAEKF